MQARDRTAQNRWTPDVSRPSALQQFVVWSIALNANGIKANLWICNGKIHTEGVSFLGDYRIDPQGMQVGEDVVGKPV